MKIIHAKEICIKNMSAKDKLKDALLKAHTILPNDVEQALAKAREDETSSNGKIVMDAIFENIEIAKKKNIPLCQDTGMFWCLCKIGREAKCNLAKLETAINDAAKEASMLGFYRKSVVQDPIYDRKNTNTNLPVLINYTLVDGDKITISFLLKGFGSENCSSVRMLNPTAGEGGVVDAVLDIMKKAGAKPCPPTFIGVGIGGTMDRSALLSKMAFFKDEEENSLERRIKQEINSLMIGPGGLGGINSCLSVQILTCPTHIAGLPVAVTVNCWADRKAVVVLDEEDFE